MTEEHDLLAAARSLERDCAGEPLEALAEPLHRVAQRLALHGCSELALDLWETGCLEGMPEPPESIWGDASHRVHAFIVGREDRSRPNRRPGWLDRKDRHLTLGEWVRQHGLWTARRLIATGWSAEQVAQWEFAEPESMQWEIRRFHRALTEFDDSAREGRRPDRALNVFEDLATASKLPVYKRRELLLVSALRNLDDEDEERADELIRMWLDLEPDEGDVEHALGLPAIVHRLIDGVLRGDVNTDEVKRTVRAAISYLRERLGFTEEAEAEPDGEPEPDAEPASEPPSERGADDVESNGEPRPFSTSG